MVNVRNVNKVPHVFWSKFDWADLNEHEKEHWEVFGHDQNSWDGTSNIVINKFATYSKEVQDVILELGFDQVAWDEFEVNPTFPVKLFEGTNREVTVDNITDYWYFHKYDDLSPFQKRLFEILGKVRNDRDYYNSSLKKHDDLSVEQKHAVEFLDMTPTNWNKLILEYTPVDLSFPVTVFKGTPKEKIVKDIFEYWGEHAYTDISAQHKDHFRELDIDSSNWTTFQNAFKDADTTLANLDNISNVNDRKLIKKLLTKTYDLGDLSQDENFALLILGLLDKVPTDKNVILSVSVVKDIPLLDSVLTANDIMQLIKFTLN